MNKSLLYIAYHFPPIQVSSGVHRTLAFSRYLAEHDWDVTVLTVDSKAYQQINKAQQDFIPANINVVRAYARDTARHFTIKGRYLGWMALPDRWQSWILGGVISGLKQIRKHKPAVILSTYPIASAHIIGYLLHKISGIPWVADLRDPMLQQGYPSNPAQRKIFAWIEQKIVKHCQKVLLTSPGAVALYRERYPHSSADFWQLIPNGYDSAMFEALPVELQQPKVSQPDKPLVMLHSGTIYPSERDPAALFQALAELKQQDAQFAQKFQLILRATGHDDLFAPQLLKWQINDIVQLAPSVGYLAALTEMFEVDALLLLQAANCNYQTPAKAYEYLRARRPVLALTPAESDTAALVQKSGVATIAPLDDVTQIKTALLNLLEKASQQQLQYLSDDEMQLHSRQFQAAQLETLLGKIAEKR
ncbi:glycosyltransferase [Rheinheimera sp.]|uniref:glycosyltransferase n=1 Tax=Rheinheimera sp. TaxID=1869214 RepID=UPI0027BB1D39|nr:glycosyltransferase [Rheinheimera sp.]